MCLLLITTERYICITQPYKSKSSLDQNKKLKYVLVVWVDSLYDNYDDHTSTVDERRNVKEIPAGLCEKCTKLNLAIYHALTLR